MSKQTKRNSITQTNSFSKGDDQMPKKKINIRSDIRSAETSTLPPKKSKLVNMNYPPADMPLEEIRRFWGEPSKDDATFLRDIKVNKNAKKRRPNVL